MKILAITKRRAETDPARIAALQVPEALAVWGFIQDGFVREIYFDKKRPAVVLVLEEASVEAAQTRLADLPMVNERQIDFDYFELGPYLQLAHLFAPYMIET